MSPSSASSCSSVLVCFLLHIALQMLFPISFPPQISLELRTTNNDPTLQTPYSCVYRTSPSPCELGSRLQGAGQYLEKNLGRVLEALFLQYSASLFDSIFQRPYFLLHVIAHSVRTNGPTPTAPLMKYVDSAQHRPVECLEAVLRIVNSLGDIPFSELDCLYGHIFASVHNVKGALRIHGAL